MTLIFGAYLSNPFIHVNYALNDQHTFPSCMDLTEIYISFHVLAVFSVLKVFNLWLPLYLKVFYVFALFLDQPSSAHTLLHNPKERCPWWPWLKKKKKRQVSFFRPTFILTMMQVLFLPLRHCSPCLTSIVLSAYVCCNTFVSAYHNVSKIIRGLILCWKLFFVCQTVILMFV